MLARVAECSHGAPEGSHGTPDRSHGSSFSLRRSTIWLRRAIFSLHGSSVAAHGAPFVPHGPPERAHGTQNRPHGTAYRPHGAASHAHEGKNVRTKRSQGVVPMPIRERQQLQRQRRHRHGLAHPENATPCRSCAPVFQALETRTPAFSKPWKNSRFRFPMLGNDGLTRSRFYGANENQQITHHHPAI